MQTAFLLLIFASVAALQARAIRGARRHHLQDVCQHQKQPEIYDEILSSGEGVAFVAATVVTGAAVLATLMAASHLATNNLAILGWMVLCWGMLVIVPMLLTRLAGVWIVVVTWWLWRPLIHLVRPLVAIGRSLLRLASRFLPRSSREAAEDSQDEIRLAMDEAHREGHLDEEARDMIQGVMELEDVHVSEIMTPRTEMIGLPLASPWDDVVATAIESGHSRLPVWRASSDDIVGVLHSREILTELARCHSSDAGTPPDLNELIRPPYFIPETMSVQTLLRELQRGKSHMAIVTDEFGGVCGVVTIEDALEEIVGEIADEHDEAFDDGILAVSENVCETLAHVPLDDLNERMQFSLPEEADFDTIGGFAFHVFGRIPEVGEQIEADGVALEVLAATGRKIERLRVTRLPSVAKPS